LWILYYDANEVRKLRIKEVETLVGITRKNIRFYEKEGLLNPGRDSENSYREYSEQDVCRLKQIKFLRKLDMPISEIKSLLDGRTSLTTALGRHSLAIDEQRKNLLRAYEVCRSIEEEGCQLPELDTDAYLLRLESMEKEGAVFRNIARSDVMKKYFGPVLGCAIVVAAAVAALVYFLWVNKTEPAPGYVLAYICAAVGVVALGTVIALLCRIKEIRKGEEDDLGNY